MVLIKKLGQYAGFYLVFLKTNRVLRGGEGQRYLLMWTKYPLSS